MKTTLKLPSGFVFLFFIFVFPVCRLPDTQSDAASGGTDWLPAQRSTNTRVQDYLPNTAHSFMRAKFFFIPSLSLLALLFSLASRPMKTFPLADSARGCRGRGRLRENNHISASSDVKFSSVRPQVISEAALLFVFTINLSADLLRCFNCVLDRSFVIRVTSDLFVFFFRSKNNFRLLHSFVHSDEKE